MKRHRPHAGFTIVELLIAAAITVLIVVMLGTMFGSLASTASRSNQRTDTFRDARAALQMIARDFANLVKIQPAAYFAINTDAAGPDVRQLDGLINLKNKPGGAPAPMASDVCAVRYYCGWNNNAYSLRRYFRDSALTYQTFESNLVAGPPPTLNYTDMSALFLGSAPVDEVLAAYAWNLRVVAYDSSGNIVNQYNDSFGRPATNAPYICDPNGSTVTLPAAIEVSFDAISPEAARALLAATSQSASAFNVWMVAGNPNPAASDKQLYDRLILPNIYHFRTRISLQ